MQALHQQKSTPDEPTAKAVRGTARLEDRYATALYELALDAKAVDSVAAELTSLQDAITGSADFARALKNPVLGKTGQANALGAITAKQGASKLVQNFTRLIAQKGRQSKLPQIIAAYHAIAAAARGELLAEVRSPMPLTEAQQQKLIAELSAKHKATTIRLNTIIDPSLLGGFSVKVGTTLYDRTLSSQLNRLMLQLKEAA